MQFKDIVIKKTYKDKEGNEKATWKTIGVLKITDSGKMFIDLFHMASELYVFNQGKKESAQSGGGF